MSPTIYVFEDDTSLRELLSELLKDEVGAETEACGSLGDLLERCAARKPDLIVADFWGTSHLTLADAERSEIMNLAAVAPLVLVTARNWVGDAEAADLGIVALLPKPLDLDGLVTVVREAIEASPSAAGRPTNDAPSVFVLGRP